MNAAVIAAAGISALSVFFFLVEGDGLVEGHARVRTHLLNAARWATVIALSWTLIPVSLSQPGPDRAASILGLAALIGAVLLIPVAWLVRLGGRERAWELRRAKVEVAQLANRIRRRPGSVTTYRLKYEIDRIAALRDPGTAELCDLLTAELDDLVAGVESWNEAGRRSIRMDDLCRRLWPDETPLAENDPDEATFRWQLYRTFGRMMEIGSLESSACSRKDFRKLKTSLDGFRRPDTFRFIDAVQQSGDRWLARRGQAQPWITSYAFETLGPDGLAEVRRIWPRDAVMWGADLDDDDRLALKQDLARRAAVAAPPSDPPNVPVESAS
jgi:hypothetical protein